MFIFVAVKNCWAAASASDIPGLKEMQINSRFVRVFVTVCALASVAGITESTALAQSPEGASSARNFVARLGRDAVEKLPARGLGRAGARAAFQKILRENFDVAGIGRRVFAAQWASASAKQRKEALRLYETWVTDGLMNLLSRHNGERFRLLSAATTVKISGGYRVGSEIRRPNGERVRVDWFIRPAGKGWRVTNLRTPDGGDLVATHREEFRLILEQAPASAESTGLEYIIEELRIRTAPL